jgi:hypothetical protein
MNQEGSMFGCSYLKFGVLGALAMIGCGVDADESADSVPDGLTIASQTATQVTGTFAQNGVSIRFDFSLRDDGTRQAVVYDADGIVLQDSVLTPDGIETLHVLDGQLTIQGTPGDPSPKLEGDKHVFDELGQRPEAQLVVGLRERLTAAGVNTTLFAASEAPPEVAYLSSYCTYTSLVPAGQSRWYGTWSFWGWTNVQTCAAWANNYPWGPYGTASHYIGNWVYSDGWHKVYDWAFCPVSVGSCPFFYRTAAQWWGFSVEIYNSGPDPLGVTVW